jgi:arylsulfatase A-like enzyme
MKRASLTHFARAAAAGAMFVVPFASALGLIQGVLALSAHGYSGAGLDHLAWRVVRDQLLAWAGFGVVAGGLAGMVGHVPAAGWSRRLFRIVGWPVLGAVAVGFWFRWRLRQSWLAFDGPDGCGSIDLGYLWWKLAAHRDVLLAGAIAAIVVGVALAWLARRGGRPSDDVTLPIGRSRFAGVAVVGLLLAGLSVAPSLVPALRPSVREVSPNFVVISIDTLRADRLGTYGNRDGLTPNLDAFAETGLVFRDCFAQAPWTLTSHMSMFTSLYPRVHGVDEGVSLSPKVTTVAEALQNAGYSTSAVVRTVPWLEPKYGFDHGFDRYVIKNFLLDAAVQNRTVEQELARIADGPFFLFLHYFDVHSDFNRLPYDAPQPFYDDIARPAESGFEGGEGELYASDFLKHVNRERIVLPEGDRAYISSLYDAGLAYFDRCFGELLEMIDRTVDLSNTYVIVTSDHGEEFQDHGFMLHSNPRHHRELVRVPLLVRGPGVGAGQRGTLLEVLDLPPTLLEIAGAPAISDMQGVSFAELLGTIPVPSNPLKTYAFSELGPSASVTSMDFRLLIRPDLDVPFVLYDRRTDDGESRDVIEQHREVASRMMAALHERRRSEVSLGGAAVTLSEAESDLLKSLGYLE